MDYMTPKNVREGVKWLPDKQVDVFFITLNKADKDYSPTTMYNDYSINESLFHWQSQSTTSDTASTGQRYINHRQRGSKVVLFVREFKKDNIALHRIPFGNGSLCEAHRFKTNEYYMASGPADSGRSIFARRTSW